MADQPSLIDLASPLGVAERVERALEVDPLTLARWTRDRWILGLPANDGPILFYPVAQFETVGGHVRVNPDLAGFFKAAAGLDPWTVTVAMHTPTDELDGLTPLEWAEAEREPSRLIDLGERLTVEVQRR